MEGLPIYSLDIDMDLSNITGVSAIAIVQNPAIEADALFFNAQQQEFQIEDEDQQIISGPIMIADKPIYRSNEQFGEHYVMFNKNAITLMMQKYAAQGHINSANIEHNQALALHGVTLYESFQIDRDRGVNPPLGYEDLSDGSWFGSMKVFDKEVWTKIKEGKFRGFSLEGLFIYPDQPLQSDFMKSVDQLLKTLEEGN